MKLKKKLLVSYLLSDIVSAALAWTLLYFLRKKIETIKFGVGVEVSLDEKFVLGLLIIPLCWVTMYALWGMYSNLLRRHRIREVGQVAATSIIGTILVFFILLLDDQLPNYNYYYTTVGTLFFSHFLLTLVGRLIITSRTVHHVQQRKWGFPTLLVGGNSKALNLFEEVQQLRKSPGFQFKGYVKINGKDELLSKHLPLLGHINNLATLIEEHHIEEIILSVESADHKELESILAITENFNVAVNIIPDTFNILSGQVKMSSVFGIPLIRLNSELMPSWQFSIKRAVDLLLSIVALILLTPVLISIAVAVKLSSKGPVFYSQERIGKNGNPFQIYKFRSMCVDAEKNGPQLSSTKDNRITPVGKFLRKTRLDELPQFWNVVKGDMALVGPRPERQFFIDQISQVNPHYHKLHRIRPGITSWGQVKYGYAENVEEMVQRLKFDLLYLENMSLAMDIKILFYTVVIMLKGSGK
jgi:exopolysaccharide biosynthesis polyprenyl glycosylphosphotransferase